MISVSLHHVTTVLSNVMETGRVRLLVLCCVLSTGIVVGDIMLEDPPQRSSMSRYGFNVPSDPNEAKVNCGGFDAQWAKKDLCCGICGDACGAPTKYEYPGKFATGTIGKTYISGTVVPVKVNMVSSNQRGHFWFRLCERNSKEQNVNEDCLNRHPLVITTTNQFAFYPGSQARVISLSVQLPRITCTQCVLQMKYKTGNKFGTSEGCACVGCGKQEYFINCADIAITSPPTTQAPFDLGHPITTPPPPPIAVTTSNPNAVTTPDPNAVTTPDPNAVTTPDPNAATTADPNAATTADPNAATTADPNAATTADPNAATTADPNAATTADPNAATTADPNAATTADPNAATTADPNAATTPDPNAATTADPNAATTPDPNAATTPDPNAATTADPNAATTADPNAATTADPNAATTADPNAATTADPNAATTADPNAATTADPNAATTPDPNAATTADPNAATTADPNAATTPDPNAATTPDPNAATTADPNAATTADPNAATTADPNAATTADPNAATTADPNAATTADPNAATTADPNAATTADPNTATTADPAGQSGTTGATNPSLTTAKTTADPCTPKSKNYKCASRVSYITNRWCLQNCVLGNCNPATCYCFCMEGSMWDMTPPPPPRLPKSCKSAGDPKYDNWCATVYTNQWCPSVYCKLIINSENVV